MSPNPTARAGGAGGNETERESMNRDNVPVTDEWRQQFAEAAAFAAGNGNWVCPICLNVLMWGCDECHGGDESHAPYPRPRASAVAIKRGNERAELLRLIRQHCRVIYHPPNGEYPIEHTLAANKDMWHTLLAELRSAAALTDGGARVRGG